MKVLVVGGAGYIGSHMVRLLDRAGHQVIVLDNLSTGFAAAVTAGELIVGDMQDRNLVERILGDHQVDAVMHFAACALVGESVVEPAKYYQNNVSATLELLEGMRRCDVKQIVFSSTCATYGVPNSIPISESESQQPVNPYGFTKLVIERALEDYAAAYGFGYAALRYFNAAGASPEGDIGEDHDPESHLIPIVLQVALNQRPQITVFGDDWDTPDGTCVRDYIHVVRQIIESCREVTGLDIAEVSGARRPGDPPALVADARLAKSILGWEPAYSLPTPIIETAWNWHKHHPKGYDVR